MYSRESVMFQIRKNGILSFIEMISSPDFSEEIKVELEKIHIFRNGFPCLSAIYALAQ